MFAEVLVHIYIVGRVSTIFAYSEKPTCIFAPYGGLWKHSHMIISSAHYIHAYPTHVLLSY